MRVVLLSGCRLFRMAAAQGILDTQAKLVAILRGNWKKGVAGLAISLGHIIMGSRAGRLVKLTSDPSYAFARQNKVKYLMMPSVRDPGFVKILSGLQPDVVIVASFDEILPPKVISIARLGMINVHPSLLPQLRGPVPIAGAIIKGLSESGVSIHFVDEGIDSGDIILQKRLPVEATDTHHALREKMARLIRPMTAEVIRMFLKGNVPRMKQDPSRASYFKITKIFRSRDIYVDWSQPSRAIERFVRAGVRCLTSYKGMHFRISAARIVPSRCWDDVRPGAIFEKTALGLLVGTGDAPLEVIMYPTHRQHRWLIREWFRWGRGSLTKAKELIGRCQRSRLREGDQLESVNWPNLNGMLTYPQDKVAT